MSKRMSLESLIKLRMSFSEGSLKAYNIYKSAINGEKISEADIKKINEIKPETVSKIINDSVSSGIEIIPINSEKYPNCLREIDVPPLILFVKGKMPDFDSTPTVTIVGPRNVSEFGEKSAYSIGLRLSKAGFNIVSGAAIGADTATLRGALDGSGTPVGVLGCGICYDYLPENRVLREKIANKGCLISEYPPFNPTTRYCFPIRNRIMSALSLATIVVEAGEKSGALVTARHALEQGRDVFAIPGRVTDKNSVGANALIRDGASPLLDLSDVFNLYLPQFADKIDLDKAFSKKTAENNEKIAKKTNLGLSKNANIIYNNIVNNKFSADDMLNTNLSVDEILSALTELEISNLIKSLPGGFYKIL